MCDRPPGLFEWAFGPRNPMKNPVKRRDFPDVRSGFSTLSPGRAPRFIYASAAFT
jgi:hypothetical protein